MPWFTYALLSALFASFAGVVEKKTLNSERSLEFAFSLSLVNALFSLLLIPFVDFGEIGGLTLIYIYLGSVLSATAFFCIVRAIRHNDLSSIVPITILGPGITTLVAFIFLGEKISAQGIFGIILIMIGVFIVVRSKDGDRDGLPRKYFFLVLLALALYGFSATIDRYMVGINNVPPLTYLVLVQIFIAINFFLLVVFTKSEGDGFQLGFKKFGKFIVGISVLTLAYRWFQIEAVSLAEVGLVEAVKRTSVLGTIVLAGEFFKERDLSKKLFATAIMIFGLTLLVF